MTFVPERLAISNITRAIPAVVTTTTDHNLTTGQVVRTVVPKPYGMVELNGKQLSITVISNTTFSLQYSLVPPKVNVDSREFTAFTTVATPALTAQILPIGSGPTPITNPEVYLRNNVCDTPIEDATYNNSTVEIPF